MRPSKRASQINTSRRILCCRSSVDRTHHYSGCQSARSVRIHSRNTDRRAHNTSRIIITAIIRRHIRPFRTSNHESCNDACTKDRQQECSTAAHGFGFCYRLHQMFPFRLSCDFPVLSRSRALFRAWDLVKKDVRKVGRISVHQTRHPPYLGTSA